MYYFFGMLSGCAIFIERAERRPEVALFVLAIFYRIVIDEGGEYCRPFFRGKGKACTNSLRGYHVDGRQPGSDHAAAQNQAPPPFLPRQHLHSLI